MTADEVLLKQPSKVYPPVDGKKAAKGLVKQDTSPLSIIYKYRNAKVKPFIRCKDLNCGEGNPVPACEAGISISF